MTVHRVVCLDLPSKDDILLLGRNLEGVVMPLPAKEARQDLDEAGVGSHEVVVDQASAVHAHLQPRWHMVTYSQHSMLQACSLLVLHQFRLICLTEAACIQVAGSCFCNHPGHVACITHSDSTYSQMSTRATNSAVQTHQCINRSQLTQVLQILLRVVQVDGPALDTAVARALRQLPQVTAGHQLLKVHDAPLVLALYESYPEEIVRLLHLCQPSSCAVEVNNLQSRYVTIQHSWCS